MSIAGNTDAPLLDAAQEMLRFLDGYFAHYLGQAAARLQPGRPVVTAGGGLGLMSILLAREANLVVYAWEPRDAWRALAQAWVAENGLEERVIFLPPRFEGLPSDPYVQGVLIEPPLISLLDTPAWWRGTRAILDWAGGAAFLPAGIGVSAAAGIVRGPRSFLQKQALEGLRGHYRNTLGADLEPVIREARAQLHPRLLHEAPTAPMRVGEWQSTPLDLAAWHEHPRQTLQVTLSTPKAAAVNRLFVALSLTDADGTSIGSSLFESHQQLELMFPEDVWWTPETALVVRVEITEHGPERYTIQFLPEAGILAEGWRGALATPESRGDATSGWSTAPPPEGFASWPSSAPRFHLADHLAMLNDRPRVEAYQRALAQRLRGGEHVLDLGAGTGLLGLAALRSGADHLLSVDRDSYVLGIAEAVLQGSGVAERVRLLRGLSHTLPPGEARVDLLVSEILGDKALNEGVLEYMVDARDRFCKPGAAVIPQRLEVFLAGCESGQYVGHVMQGIRQHLEGDLQLSALTYAAAGPRLLTGSVARFDPERDTDLTESVRIGDFDLETLSLDAVHFSVELALAVQRTGLLNAFFVWFTATLGEGIALSNSPFETRTHWRQLRLHDFPPRPVTVGEVVRVRVAYRGELVVQLL